MNNTQEKTDSAKSIHTITNALLEDLFNPSISTLDLCNLHEISLPELAATLESETFIAAKEAFERINAARRSIIEPEARALAIARLSDILKDKPDTPAHAETQRKVAIKVLASASSFQPVPAADPHAPQKQRRPFPDASAKIVSNANHPHGQPALNAGCPPLTRRAKEVLQQPNPKDPPSPSGLKEGTNPHLLFHLSPSAPSA